MKAKKSSLENDPWCEGPILYSNPLIISLVKIEFVMHKRNSLLCENASNLLWFSRPRGQKCHNHQWFSPKGQLHMDTHFSMHKCMCNLRAKGLLGKRSTNFQKLRAEDFLTFSNFKVDRYLDVLQQGSTLSEYFTPAHNVWKSINEYLDLTLYMVVTKTLLVSCQQLFYEELTPK